MLLLLFLLSSTVSPGIHSSGAGEDGVDSVKLVRGFLS